MRQISLDTETTGLSTLQGHRIIEIGCVEIVDRKLTGQTFHTYINPGREIDAGAFAVHGIATDFLKDKPIFNEISKRLLEFISGAELLIHNAPFDVGFLNYELELLDHPNPIPHYCTVFDTLVFARKKHPGQKNNLDALCKRYNVDNSRRQLHGALLDAELLARLYLMMTGGQGTLFEESMVQGKESELASFTELTPRKTPLSISQVTEEEELAHLAFIEILKKSGCDLWKDEG